MHLLKMGETATPYETATAFETATPDPIGGP
jgi:hypothetical protein